MLAWGGLESANATDMDIGKNVPKVTRKDCIVSTNLRDDIISFGVSNPHEVC
jgi:hypothetical protein